MANLQDKSRDELEKMAKKIPGISQSGMSKDELIQKIEKFKGGGKDPSAPGQGGGQGDTPPRSPDPRNWKNEPGNQS